MTRGRVVFVRHRTTGSMALMPPIYINISIRAPSPHGTIERSRRVVEPQVRRLCAAMAWEDVSRSINAPLAASQYWTQRRLLRAVNAYVRDGFLPEAVLGRAGMRVTDNRLPAIVAGIKGADPSITLQGICGRLEAMRERTPRGRTNWQPSSIRVLLAHAEKLGML
jgi:hypothetical protein